MSTVNNKKPMERIIHQGFHMLALKHKIDADRIAEIVQDWDNWKDANLEKKSVRKVTSKTGAFDTIIELLVPVRFYWDKVGKFDGMEVGSSKRGLTRYEIRLLDQVFDVLAGSIAQEGDSRDDVPQAFRDALDSEEGDK